MNEDELLKMGQEIRLLTTVIGKFARQELEQRLHEAGIGIGALPFGVLHVLNRRHAQTIKELSDYMMLTPATLVPAVDALQHGGYLMRSKDPRDRRRVALTITSAGYDLLQRFPAMRHDDQFVCALTAIGAPERQQLYHLLRAFVRQLPNGDEMLLHLDAAE